MPIPLLALAAGVVALHKKGGRGKKIIDLTKGIFGDLAIGAGAGAFINWADKHFLNGKITSLGVAMPGLKMGLNATDAILLLTTTGIETKGQALKTSLATLAGKKLGENLGAIDPPEPNFDLNAGSGSTNKSGGVRT